MLFFMNRISSKRRAEEREREERLQQLGLNTGPNKGKMGKHGAGNAKGRYQPRRRRSSESGDYEDDHRPGNYSPTSAMRLDDYDDPANGPHGDHSRRSSLKSTSILGMEGEDAQGPTRTLNPLDGVQGADKSSDGTFHNYPTILLDQTYFGYLIVDVDFFLF